MPVNPSNFYEVQAKALIKDLREQKQLSYKELARRLSSEGVDIDVQVLINKVNLGKYSFVFALQLLAAMGASTLNVPVKHSRSAKTSEAVRGSA